MTLTGCVSTGAFWSDVGRFTELTQLQLDMVLRQHLHHARRRQGIGVDRIDHTNAAHVYHRVTTKFRVIHHQHHVARIFDNRALGAYLMVVKFQQ